MPSSRGPLPLVKICGITSLADGVGAIECGADLLGFIRAVSPRRVTAEAAADLVKELRGHCRGPEVLMTGVFKDAPLGEVIEECRQAGYDLVQLHGQEPPDYVAKVASSGFRVMKVIHRTGVPAAAEVGRHEAAWAFLLEPEVRPELRKAGRCADFSGARLVLEAHERVGLAGNLSPDNVREALAAAGPGVWLVDAASSLESFPGVKSPELVERFVRAARGRGE